MKKFCGWLAPEWPIFVFLLLLNLANAQSTVPSEISSTIQSESSSISTQEREAFQPSTESSVECPHCNLIEEVSLRVNQRFFTVKMTENILAGWRIAMRRRWNVVLDFHWWNLLNFESYATNDVSIEFFADLRFYNCDNWRGTKTEIYDEVNEVCSFELLKIDFKAVQGCLKLEFLEFSRCAVEKKNKDLICMFAVLFRSDRMNYWFKCGLKVPWKYSKLQTASMQGNDCYNTYKLMIFLRELRRLKVN